MDNYVLLKYKENFLKFHRLPRRRSGVRGTPTAASSPEPYVVGPRHHPAGHGGWLPRTGRLLQYHLPSPSYVPQHLETSHLQVNDFILSFSCLHIFWRDWQLIITLFFIMYDRLFL